MKHITEYLHNHLCGKQLFESSHKYYDLDIPKIDSSLGELYKDAVVGNVRIPVAKYYLFKDNYLGSVLHLGNIDDLVATLTLFYESDFEDFNPKKDIVYCSDNLVDVIGHYFKITGITPPRKGDDIGDFVEKYKDEFDGHDELESLFQMYLGEMDYEDFGYDYNDEGAVIELMEVEYSFEVVDGDGDDDEWDEDDE